MREHIIELTRMFCLISNGIFSYQRWDMGDRENCRGFIILYQSRSTTADTLLSCLKIKKMIARFEAPFEKEDFDIQFRTGIPTMSAVKNLPLHGVKVLDLTRVLAGRMQMLWYHSREIIFMCFKDLSPVWHWLILGRMWLKLRNQVGWRSSQWGE